MLLDTLQLINADMKFRDFAILSMLIYGGLGKDLMERYRGGSGQDLHYPMDMNISHDACFPGLYEPPQKIRIRICVGTSIFRSNAASPPMRSRSLRRRYEYCSLPIINVWDGLDSPNHKKKAWINPGFSRFQVKQIEKTYSEKS